ncbi:hypothetical protein GCM10009799_46980 [Nocardiopsis rhodophaea]|uniref:Uncharacterized protein n=1 Tax=Nocardiopsis rhodophaea TaxID=280238 RepID=A0ABN2TMD1_9ACTN
MVAVCAHERRSGIEIGGGEPRAPHGGGDCRHRRPRPERSTDALGHLGTRACARHASHQGGGTEGDAAGDAGKMEVHGTCLRIEREGWSGDTGSSGRHRPRPRLGGHRPRPQASGDIDLNAQRESR